MLLLKKSTKWDDIKKVINGKKFIQKLIEFDKSTLTQESVTKLKNYQEKHNFKNETQSSYLPASLKQWVTAICQY